MNYLPSKKVVVPLSLVLVLLFITFFIPNTKKIENRNDKNLSSSVKQIELSKISEKDSDNDGLVDWEEALWRTDANNPDTDGDGTSDGEEVKLSRDPNLAGPNDFIEKVVPLDYEGSKSNNKITTTTGKVAIDLFSRYLNAKGTVGGELSKDESTNIQNTVANSFFIDLESSQNLPEFLPKDINVIETSKSSLKNYGNSLGLIILKYEDEEKHGDPVDILTEAIKEKSYDKAYYLKTLAQNYILGAKEMAEIPTPKDMLSLHLSLVNNLVNTGNNISTLGDVLVDPLSSLGALSLYTRNASILADSINRIKEFLKSNNISYTPQEVGYTLINSI